MLNKQIKWEKHLQKSPQSPRYYYQNCTACKLAINSLCVQFILLKGRCEKKKKKKVLESASVSVKQREFFGMVFPAYQYFLRSKQSSVSLSAGKCAFLVSRTTQHHHTRVWKQPHFFIDCVLSYCCCYTFP